MFKNIKINTETKILIAEHNATDIELLHHELKDGGINYVSEIVKNEKEYLHSIKNFIPDIILSDFSFPSFSGATAFEIKQEITPEIPFIFVTGTVGEEVAVEFIKKGVTDYVLKDKLFTLIPKIIRGLKEAEEKKEKNNTEQELIKSENRFRSIIEHSEDMKTLSSPQGKFLYCSPSITRILGYSTDECLDLNTYDFIHPDDAPDLEETKKMFETPGKSLHVQQRLKHKNGNWIWCEGTITNMLHEPGINALVSNFRDISEKKITEIHRQFDKNNLDALINNTSDLMWSIDLDFNLITSNKPFDEMGKVNFGKTIAKGENVLSVNYSPEMLSHFKGLYERAFEGEAFLEISYFDFPVELWTEISYCPIYKDDKVVGAACHSRDITNIKLVEKQLSKSEARLKEAQGIARIGNCEIDMVNNKHSWSDSFYKILGIINGDIEPSAEALLSSIHPEDADYAEKKIQEAFQSLIASSISFRFIPKDGNGNLRYGYTEWKFEFDKDNKPIRLYGIMQDVTEQKKAEILISESEIRLAEAQAIAKVGSWKTDLATMKVIWSAETFRIFELNPEKFQTSHPSFIEYVHPIDRAKVDAAFMASLDKDSINSIEHKIITPGGAIKIVEERWKISRDKLGIPEWAVGTCQDITERKNAEDEREKMITDMLQRKRDLEQFTFMISHNLRAPTANIIGITEYLLDETLTPSEHKTFLEGLSLSVTNLDMVIKDINEILKVKYKAEDKKEIVSFSEIVNDIIISLGNYTDKNQVYIKSDFTEIDEIFTLKAYMYSIFFNLISNSIKYRKPEFQPIIEIVSKKEKGKIILKFKDNGLGIDLKKNGDYIFKLYKRFHSHVEGKGMGLFMVKTQTEAIGGKISVESVQNRGTEFTIVFETKLK